MTGNNVAADDRNRSIPRAAPRFLIALSRRGLARACLEGAFALMLLAGVRAYMLRGVASGIAPPLAGRSLDGQRVSLDEVRGRPVAVHFWATWCGVCNLENKSITSLAQSGTVIAVATSSGDAAAVKAKMARDGLSFPVVVDPDGSIAAAWGVTRFPTTFFLDREHRVKTVESGYTTEVGLKARLAVAGI
jgi:thiol-disulfide isomerase/thioredoxin